MKLADPKAVSGVENGAPGGAGAGLVAAHGRARWQVGCSDVIGRRRELTVVVEHGRGVLVGPPGETVVLSLQQADQLRVALGEAATRAGG